MKLIKPEMMKEASVAITPKSLTLQILIFIVVFFTAQVAAGIIAFIPMLPEIAKISLSGEIGTITGALSSGNILIITLYATVIATGLTMIHCRFIERRPLSSMGFRKKNAASHYFAGIGVGLAMFALTYFICWAGGGITAEQISFKINYGMFAVYFLGFVFQGMSEEVVMRGYLMNSIGGKNSVYAAVIISSAAFSVTHALNPGTSFLAFLNLAFYGAFMAVYMICFDNIWGVCGIHTMWNFVQGNVFGVPVSGMNFGESIIKSALAPDKSFLNGGAFGVEGGIATTIVLAAAITVILIFYNKKITSVSETALKPYETGGNA